MAATKRSIFVPHASDLLTDHKPHGDGLTAFGFISRLAARGHTLHVAAPAIEISGPLPENIRLYPIKTFFKGTIPHRLEYMLKSRLLLRRLRRNERIDVIHQLNPVNKGLSLAMLGAGLPVVLGVIVPRWPDDAEGERLSWRARARIAVKHWLKQRLLTIQQWQAAALLVTTPAARASLHRPERDAHKIVVLPIGVDTKHFAPAPQAEPSEAPIILFLANLWRRKGIFTLLDAFAQVVEKIPNCRLLIAGDGDERAEVERRVAASPHQAQIEMVGRVTRADAPTLLRDCTVYCLPSYGEPFGITVLEAMACAKPVVATNAGGLKHLLPAEGGHKVPPGDAAALAQALIEVLSSPELQAEMGRHNRRAIESFYNWERVIDRLEDVYEAVIARRPPIVARASGGERQMLKRA